MKFFGDKGSEPLREGASSGVSGRLRGIEAGNISSRTYTSRFTVILASIAASTAGVMIMASLLP